MVVNVVKWTVETTETQVQSLSGNKILKVGQTEIIGESILLQASNTDMQSPIITLITTLPISEYKQKSIKFGSKIKGNGTLIITGKDSYKQYNLNSQDSDLTLQLDENPMEKGKFTRGVIYGTVTDGIEKQTLNLKLVVPLLLIKVFFNLLSVIPNGT